MKRRSFLLSAAAGISASLHAQSTGVPESIRSLRPMTEGVKPITSEERAQRIEKARKLMRTNRLDASFIGPGSTMFYFTGTRWRGADGSLGLIIPVQGDVAWVVKASDESQIRKLLRTGGDVRTWDSGRTQEKAIAEVLSDRHAATGRLGLEEQVPFSVYDGIRKAASSVEIASADPVTIGCRVIKSPAEIALMQHATDVTIAAYKAGLATLKEGMTQIDLRRNITAAYTALGFSGEVSVSFGKYTAYPHGSIQPQKLQVGDVVQIDDGCSVDGYQSDVTRTVVFGKPTKRQTDVWNLEHKAQAAAFAAAQPGASCESVDAAARNLITAAGFGPGYKVPGLPHRTGHGIGLDIHEWTYLVKGNKTPIEPGMCFSDEPMIAIYGEFGIRLEDCMYITPDGPRMFSKPSPSIDQPFG
jgi:Xaa-Pro dipeptidase